MGNCQAAEVAAAVVQHPAGGPGGGSGRVERLYWSTSAAEVMRANPGHYVALVTLRVAEDRGHGNGNNNGSGTTVRRLTRVRLLKPKEPLLLGHVYRLITAHEVTKAVQARKEEKQRKGQQQQQMEYLTSRLQKKAPAAATATEAEEDDVDEEEAALDESLDQMGDPMHVLCMIDV
ncbi:uncharacterized protein LOC100839403 isoform X2 [Brachypodium distachyon]|uniref:Uncharacterized protein n=1 Tax=Brachypodium distachyon TaxID=15368 RepID=I1IFE4_BRADI|nr:uncharacterized protein LOC100839403 isoform X2 [Brachypodium distachyon]KQK01975.1 hypothetical protein BRADI_3g59607v3 [Brachypodium distachyon]PNT69654.1 hypothetical protein BRADI_3g59607v3 [Brachypodium distachyon]|eukprot:XP_024317541.1 uncharacterized protein LOC100839403 isoform X2 [Brachypodium distachyon]